MFNTNVPWYKAWPRLWKTTTANIVGKVFGGSFVAKSFFTFGFGTTIYAFGQLSRRYALRAYAEEDTKKAQSQPQRSGGSIPLRDSATGIFTWTDVTRDNFEMLLPMFRKQLEKSLFVSIDTEFTGLRSHMSEETAFEDSVQEYYAKKREGVRKFMVLQVGICLWVPEDDKIVAYPYNFYVFPRTYQHNMYSILGKMPPDDPAFMVSSPSAEFLVENYFDFNRAISRGITFMNADKEDYYTKIGFGPYTPLPKDVEKYAAAFRLGDIVIHKEEDKQFIEKLLDDVKLWYTKSEFAEHSVPLELENLSSYQRKLVYQEVPKVYKDVMIETRSDNTMKLRKLTEDQQREYFRAITANNKRAFYEAIGFRRVMKMLFAHTNESLPEPPILVGHNMLLDLMHIYHKFERDLPENVEDFKKVVHVAMPKIVDTKHVASTAFRGLFGRSTALDVVYQRINSSAAFAEPKIYFPVGFGKTAHTGQKGFLHMAAFDAYITGFCFLKFMRYLKDNAPVTDERRNDPNYIVAFSQPFLNYVHLLWNTNRYLNLDPTREDKKRSQKH